MSHPIVSETDAKMQKALDHTIHEFANIHTGKATPTMVENIMVDAYGSHMRIKDCAAISTPDSRMIVIQPWDKGVLQAVAKGIQIANIGLNPNIDGTKVRVPLPEMSRERRQEFVKVVHRYAENGKVAVRKARHDGLDTLKKAKLPEDESKRLEKEIQALTDKAISSVGEHLASKEKELLEVN
ncbi:MAG: ribosome recycling factor [Candidatus Synoicihabitans palmerolidicus]|nr:ribosome recycling factor [Candidatus Synoicihabitans palmerolidicus]